MRKTLFILMLAMGFGATSALACSGMKLDETAQTPIPPVASAPQTPMPTEPAKQDVAAAVIKAETPAPKTN